MICSFGGCTLVKNVYFYKHVLSGVCMLIWYVSTTSNV